MNLLNNFFFRKKLWYFILMLFTMNILAEGIYLLPPDYFKEHYLLASDGLAIVDALPGSFRRTKNYRLTVDQADQIVAKVEAEQLLNQVVYQPSPPSVIALRQKALLTENPRCSNCPLTTTGSTGVVANLLAQRKKQETVYVGTVLLESSSAHLEEHSLLGGQDLYQNFLLSLSSKIPRTNANYDDLMRHPQLDYLINLYNTKNPSNIIFNLPLVDQVATIENFIQAYLGEKIDKGIIASQMLYPYILQNVDQWKESMALLKDQMTTDQKVNFISILGRDLLRTYNYNRSSAGKLSGGVDMVSLLNAIKVGNQGGVCRDVAKAQAEAMSALGLTNSYVLTYANQFGGHATAFTVDQSTNKMYKFNYDEIMVAPANGGKMALFQDSLLAENTLKYGIYDSNGQPVTTISSELSQIVKSVFGEKDDPFDHPQYSLKTARVMQDNLELSLFNGVTSKGDKLSGTAVYVRDDSKKFTNEYGISFIHLEGEHEVSSSVQNILDAYFNNNYATDPIYSKSKSSAMRFNIGSKIQVGHFETVDSFAVYGPDFGLKGSTNDADLRIYTSVDLATKVGGGILSNKTQAELTPEYRDVSDAQSLGIFVTDVQNQTAYAFKDPKFGQLALESILSVRRYGNVGAVKSEYTTPDKKTKISISASGPLTPDLPSFFPGATRNGRVLFETDFSSIGRPATLQMFYERDIDTQINRSGMQGKMEFYGP